MNPKYGRRAMSPSAVAIVAGVLAATTAAADPVTWTVPSTALSNGYGTLSGTFTFDTNTDALSNVNLSLSGGTGGSKTYSFPGFVTSAGIFMIQASSVSDSSTTPVVYFFGGPLPATPGSSPGFLIAAGTCSGVSGTLCSGLTDDGDSSGVVLTGALPVLVPTLSQSAAMALATLLAAFGFRRIRVKRAASRA